MFFCSTILLGAEGYSAPAYPAKSKQTAFLSVKRIDSDALLHLAQQQRSRGDISAAFASYQNVLDGNASVNATATAIMGQFMIRIMRNGKLSNVTAAKILNKQLQKLATSSNEPFAQELAYATATYLGNQKWVHKMSASLKAKDKKISNQATILAEKNQELENKENALHRLKEIMIGN